MEGTTFSRWLNRSFQAADAARALKDESDRRAREQVLADRERMSLKPVRYYPYTNCPMPR